MSLMQFFGFLACVFFLAPWASIAQQMNQPERIWLAQELQSLLTFEERQKTQISLNAIGIDVGIPDGVFGPSTRAGIGAFQRSIGASATGQLTRFQYQQLQKAYANALASGNAVAERAMTPSELRELQAGLRSLGYYNGSIDGVAGNRTMQAVSSFVRNQGLNADHVQTLQVLDMLRQRTAADTPLRAQAGAASPSFSCAKASTPTERAICASEPLASLDRAINDAYRTALSRTPAARRDLLKNEQFAWLARRNQCAGEAACLRDAMVTRIEFLDGQRFAALLRMAQQPGFLKGMQTASSDQMGATETTTVAIDTAVPAASNPDSALLAQALGIPVKNGYLVARHPQSILGPEPEIIAPGQMPTDANAWNRLASLAFIQRDPDAYRQGDVFVRLAALHLEGAAFDAFFPDRNALSRALNYSGIDQWREYNAHPFGDEFAYPDKRSEFFNVHFPRLLEKAPRWPLPIMHVVPFRLGSYDLDRGAFPLMISLTGDQKSLHIAAFSSKDTEVADTIASADLIAELPKWLEMPVEEARRLRAEKPGNAVVYLGWYAELNWGAAVSAPATTSGAKTRAPAIPRGTATLKHVGLYRDPQLSSPLAIYDTATFGKRPIVKSVARSSAIGVDGKIDVSKIVPATSLGLFKHVIESIGPERLPFLIGNAPQLRRANEFDRADILSQLIQQIDAEPLDELWIQASLDTGVYEVALGSFDIATQSRAFGGFQSQDQFGVRVNVNVSPPVELGRLAVPISTARHIVETMGRKVDAALLIEIDRAAIQNATTILAFARPKALVITTTDSETRERVVLQSQIFTHPEPSETTTEFVLPDEPVPFTVVTGALLHAATLDETRRGTFLEKLMPLVWHSERSGFALPGEAFFDRTMPLPTGEVIKSFLPDFEPWAMARAEALRSATFALSSPQGRFVTNSCQYGVDAEPNYAYAQSPLGQALGIGPLKLNRRTAGGAETPQVIAFDLLHYTADLSNDRTPCKYSEWNLFAALSKAATWSDNLSLQTNLPLMRHVFAKVDGVESMGGATDVDDILVRFSAVNTVFAETNTSGHMGREIARVAATAPSLQETQEQAARAESTRPFQPEFVEWSGPYQCDGVASAQMNIAFKFPTVSTITATIDYAVSQPIVEVGTLFLQGEIDKQSGAFSLTEGRWIYNGQGRPVPSLSGRFLSDGKALDIFPESNGCHSFDLRPGTADLTTEGQRTSPTASTTGPVAANPALQQSEFDVVGLRTGMSLEEAQQIILREFKIAAVYEAMAGSPGDLKSMGFARVFMGDQGMQTVTLFAPNRNGPVTAISRHVNRRGGAFEFASLTKRLVEKYGDSLALDVETTSLTWADDPTCGPLLLKPIPQRYFSPIQGVSSGGLLPGQSDLQHAVTDLAFLLAGDAQDALRREACSEVLQFAPQALVPKPDLASFNLFLIDFELVRQFDGVPEGHASDSGDEIKL